MSLLAELRPFARSHYIGAVTDLFIDLLGSTARGQHGVGELLLRLVVRKIVRCTLLLNHFYQLAACFAQVQSCMSFYVYGELFIVRRRHGEPQALATRHQNFLIGVQLPSEFISKKTEPGGIGAPPSVTTSRTLLEFSTPVYPRAPVTVCTTVGGHRWSHCKRIFWNGNPVDGISLQVRLQYRTLNWPLPVRLQTRSSASGGSRPRWNGHRPPFGEARSSGTERPSRTDRHQCARVELRHVHLRNGGPK
jgi:hypothetical protein